MARPNHSTRIEALESQNAAIEKRLGLIEARQKAETGTRTANDDTFAKRLRIIEEAIGTGGSNRVIIQD